jgi:hypothetical protein
MKSLSPHSTFSTSPLTYLLIQLCLQRRYSQLQPLKFILHNDQVALLDPFTLLRIKQDIISAISPRNLNKPLIKSIAEICDFLFGSPVSDIQTRSMTARTVSSFYP